MSEETTRTREAIRLVLSYPADLSEWGRMQVETPTFRSYLGKTLGETSVGETVEEFVGVGCCGNALDVPLRVESLEGGRRIGPDTEIEYVEREACDLEGGWQVQSAAGPDDAAGIGDIDDE